jgi:hypothetical protein
VLYTTTHATHSVIVIQGNDCEIKIKKSRDKKLLEFIAEVEKSKLYGESLEFLLPEKVYDNSSCGSVRVEV